MAEMSVTIDQRLCVCVYMGVCVDLFLVLGGDLSFWLLRLGLNLGVAYHELAALIIM